MKCVRLVSYYFTVVKKGDFYNGYISSLCPQEQPGDIAIGYPAVYRLVIVTVVTNEFGSLISLQAKIVKDTLR